MTTTTNTPTLADLPAGHPVVVTWGSGVPGVNVGGRAYDYLTGWRSA